jgi:hypothetical protein
MAGFGLATATLRQKRNVWLNEEDAKRFSGEMADIEHQDVARLLRVHRNQLENCVPFFLLGLLWVVSESWGRLAVALFLAFTLSRVLHPLFYLTGRGRLRTASFTLSFLVNVVLASGLMYRATIGGGLAPDSRLEPPSCPLPNPTHTACGRITSTSPARTLWGRARASDGTILDPDDTFNKLPGSKAT